MKKESYSKVAKAVLSEVEWWFEGVDVVFSRDSLGRKIQRMEKAYANWQINSALRYAEDRGYMKVGKKRYVITQKGRRWIDFGKLRDANLAFTKEKWDGHWRLIIFDVPETERAARNILREKLFSWECTKLQNSVFITPHACEKELEQLAKALSAETYIHLIRSDDIGQELSRQLTREYNLK